MLLLHIAASTSARPSPRQCPTPVTTTRLKRPAHRAFDARAIARRKQASTVQRDCRERNVHRELRLKPMPQVAAGGARRNIRVLGEERALLRGRRLRTGRAGNDRQAARAAGDSLLHIARNAAVAAPRSRLQRSDNTARQARERLGAARLRMSALFDHQEGAERAEREAALGRALPHRREPVLEIEPSELIEHQQVFALAVMRTADQHDVALPGGDTRERDPHRIDAGGLLAHEGARGAGDAVHDRDIARKQVGQLRQEQRRAQVAHQAFVEESIGIVGLRQAGEDRAVGRKVALAAAGGHDHVHAREHLGIAFDAGGIEREPRGIGADALPRLHLALVALLRNLLVEFERRDRMHHVGRKCRACRRRACLRTGAASARPAPRRGRRRCRRR